MFSEERRKNIFEMVQKEGRVLAKDLADQFNVSIDSIRRDLSLLEKERLVKRTHGGAIPYPDARTKPHPPHLRYSEGNPFQHAIAKKAASYIQKDQTLFIGGAAIHYVMLNYLPEKINFTVVTNSVELAYELRHRDHIQTFLIGGSVKSSGNMTDMLANEFLQHFHFDLCFATAGGISAKGLSTATPEVAIFHKNVFDRSRQVIALIEHTKFGVDMFSSMSSLNELNLIITDDGVDNDHLQEIETLGTEIIIEKGGSSNDRSEKNV
ncbi:DeoR/GlpR family DNA-binding transcription regulator [Evansella halocellulosilytica]|uniref:DeoR/GlpR family DNA-binding transcription regulator n=1 Tax=Evansella halocellulosilytica TaxID=2011013 RepID=UPI000BB7D5B9|nr:DeoR/GlpR family DNA-binding transcription regulator [Evansella halocellulosilytica]